VTAHPTHHPTHRPTAHPTHKHKRSDEEVADEEGVIIDWTSHCQPIQNQGSCGSCYAFGSIAAIETQLSIKGKGKHKLSEQDFIDCTFAEWGNAAPTNFTFLCTKFNMGCNGGSASCGIAALQQKRGNHTFTESQYPYHRAKGTCHSPGTPNNLLSNLALHVVSSKHLGGTGFNEADMAAQLKHGPLIIQIYASSTKLQHYRSGVYNDPVGCGSRAPNHIVLLVGMGVDTKTHLPYWKIRNSWGTNWGERGYLRMIRGKGMCAITQSEFDYLS